LRPACVLLLTPSRGNNSCAILRGSRSPTLRRSSTRHSRTCPHPHRSPSCCAGRRAIGRAAPPTSGQLPHRVIKRQCKWYKLDLVTIWERAWPHDPNVSTMQREGSRGVSALYINNLQREDDVDRWHTH